MLFHFLFVNFIFNCNYPFNFRDVYTYFPHISRNWLICFQDPQHNLMMVFYYMTFSLSWFKALWLVNMAHAGYLERPDIGRNSLWVIKLILQYRHDRHTPKHVMVVYISIHICILSVHNTIVQHWSSDRRDLSRKNILTMQVCPMMNLETLTRNLMRLTKSLWS